MLAWFVNLVTASQLLNFTFICGTFLCWRRALAAQNVPLASLPYISLFQPYAAWIGLVCCLTMAFVGGYTVLLPGQWDVPTFLFSYFMIGFVPVLFVGWKVVKKSEWRDPARVDLRGEVAEIEEYTRAFVPKPPRLGFVYHLVGVVC